MDTLKRCQDVYHSMKYNSEDLKTTKMFQTWGLVNKIVLILLWLIFFFIIKCLLTQTVGSWRRKTLFHSPSCLLNKYLQYERVHH